jgi:hypothetical protein
VRPIKLPQGNASPILTTLAIVGAVLLVLNAGAYAAGLTPEAAADLSTPIFMAGVVLGAWASQASSSWSRVGYVWRFGVALIVVILLTVICGAPGDAVGARSR